MQFDKAKKARGLLGDRLRLARKGVGLSTRAVAEKLGSRLPISHATLANYETGATRPPLEVVAALASVYQRPLNWFLADGPELTGVRYRNLRSRVGVRDRLRFEGECLRWLDAYASIERFLDDHLAAQISCKAKPGRSAGKLAAEVRGLLGLDDDDRVESVVDVLELFGVRVIQMPTDLAIDGIAAMRGDEPVVVLSDNVANDRARMNAAHELGHVVSGDCGSDRPESDADHGAFEFASRLLLTTPMLKEAFKRKSVVDLVRFKERFGISMSAMVFRAQAERLITGSTAKHLWIEFSKRGWRDREPGVVWPDRPTRFEALVDGALVAKQANLTTLAEVAGVREQDLRDRLARATNADHYGEVEDDERPEHRLRLVK